MQHHRHTAIVTPLHKLMHVPVGEAGCVHSGGCEFIECSAKASHEGTYVHIADSFGKRQSQSACNGLNRPTGTAQPPEGGEPVDTDPCNVLNGRSVRALTSSRPKARGAKCIRCDHVDLVTAGSELLGKTLHQHSRTVDRGEVGLRHEDKTPRPGDRFVWGFHVRNNLFGQRIREAIREGNGISETTSLNTPGEATRTIAT